MDGNFTDTDISWKWSPKKKKKKKNKETQIHSSLYDWAYFIMPKNVACINKN